MDRYEITVDRTSYRLPHSRQNFGNESTEANESRERDVKFMGFSLRFKPGVHYMYPMRYGFKFPNEIGSFFQPFDSFGRDRRIRDSSRNILHPTRHLRRFFNPYGFNLIIRDKLQSDTIEDKGYHSDNNQLTSEAESEEHPPETVYIDEGISHVTYANASDRARRWAKRCLGRFGRVIYFNYQWLINEKDLTRMKEWKTVSSPLLSVKAYEQDFDFMVSFTLVQPILCLENDSEPSSLCDWLTLSNISAEAVQELKILRSPLLSRHRISSDEADWQESVLIKIIQCCSIEMRLIPPFQLLCTLAAIGSFSMQTARNKGSRWPYFEIVPQATSKIIDLMSSCFYLHLTDLRNKGTQIRHLGQPAVVSLEKMRHIVLLLALRHDNNEAVARCGKTHSERSHHLIQTIDVLLQMKKALDVKSSGRHHPLWSRLKYSTYVKELLNKNGQIEKCGMCHKIELDMSSNFALQSCCEHVFCSGCLRNWLQRE